MPSSRIDRPDEHSSFRNVQPSNLARRRWRLPLVLFVRHLPLDLLGRRRRPGSQPALISIRPPGPTIEARIGRTGSPTCCAVMAIFWRHEMGHFVLTLRHRIPASWPFFIPMPLSPIGTMGAVIGMQAFRANRRQLFDIGIAGPLAGLVVAIPITVLRHPAGELAVRSHAESSHGGGERSAGSKVSSRSPSFMIHCCETDDSLAASGRRPRASFVLNPLWMAGWVGLLITGLNMLPISQLDGGHISYALFGRRATFLGTLRRARCGRVRRRRERLHLDADAVIAHVHRHRPSANRR